MAQQKSSKGKRKRSSKRWSVTALPEHLQQVNLNAAGVDIGSDRHFAAVPVGRDKVSVREFGAFTADLLEVVAWFKQCGITTVAMESTGVYWIPLYDILEQHGFEVKLVDARQARNLPGRKSDVMDCQWLQQLHTYGLLRGAYRPHEQVCVVRGYVRQREMLVQTCSMHIQHMQKALQQMNLLLHNVVSDLTGVTGMKIIKAIIEGERDAKKLAQHRDRRCAHSATTIAKSLVGNFREEHLFALGQAVSLYETYQEKIAECEAALLKYLAARPSLTEAEPPAGDKPLRKRNYVRAGVDVRSELYRQAGVDLFQLPALGADHLLTLAGEVGFDMTPWPNQKHFTSWLALCSGTKKSNGKVLSRRTKRSANRAAHAFRMAAASLSRSKTALGAFYRRIRARVGAPQAVTATARKLAELYYTMLKHGAEYVEQGQEAYEMKFQERRLQSIQKQALKLGYQLTPAT